MLEKLDSEDISEYMAYDRLEPIGGEKEVYMIAQLTALLANVNGGKTKVSDFIPKPAKPISVIDKIKAAFNGARRN